MIAAILRAQFLSLRPASSRAAGLSIVASVLWYGFWLFAAIAAGFFTAIAPAATLIYAFPLGLLGVCVYWQAMPVISASMGSSLDLRKLLVYPAPHEKLFVIELLLRWVAGIEMQMVLAGGAIGLLRNRALRGLTILPSLAAGFALLVVMNVLLASGTRSLLERLLSRRRIREVVALLMASIWLAPRFFMMTGTKPAWLYTAGDWMGAFGWPWSAAAHAALPLGQSDGHAALSWVALFVWVGLAGWFGRSQFERSLRYDSLAAQATPLTPVSGRSRRWSERFYRLPSLLWSDPLAAIVEKELRTLMRSARFRMVFLMGLVFGLMFWLPMIVGRHGSRSGFVAHNFLVVICIYAMTLTGQVTYWNCFGMDRSAALFYFAAPQPMSRTLLGKNIASVLFVYVQAVILMGLTLAVRVSYTFGQVMETFAVLSVCATYLLALGNIGSVHYPRALSAEHVGQAAGGNRAQGLLMLFYPVVLLPVILAYVARFAFDSEVAFVAVLAIAALIAGIFYWLAMDSAVKTASARRQQILEELTRGDGPVTS